MIGAGGIGTGLFFAIQGDATLGREESRGGHLLPRQDYCKLHIISHYVKALLGTGFTVLPASKVGGDDAGRRLLEEMRAAGLDTRYVAVSPGDATLFSICFTYPDGSGGNLTTLDSAASRVDESFIAALEPEFARFQGAGIALAAPEAPLPARIKLLELGGRYGFLRAAGLTSEEARSSEIDVLLSQADLLAVNLDEACALAGLPDGAPVPQVLQALRGRLQALNTPKLLSVTAGKSGSWCWDGASLSFLPALPVAVAGTAGAGDAHLSGLLAGLACGFSLPQAHHLARLAAAFSVTSPDTIHKGLNRQSLFEFASTQEIVIEPSLQLFLERSLADDRD